MNKIVGVVIALAGLLLVVCQQQPTVDGIVSKQVQAQGGAEKLMAIQDQVSTWDSQGSTPMGDSMMTWNAKMVITYKRPNKIKFESTGPDGSLMYASVFNGAAGWMYFMGAPVREYTQAEIEEAAVMAETWLDGWLNYAEKGIKLEMLADTTLEGKAYHVIKSTDKYGNTSTNYCDAQTGMCERMEAEMTDPMEMVKKFGVMTFTNYMPHDGFMMAEKIDHRDASGNLLFEATLTELKNNTGVSDDAFVQPVPPPAPEEPVASMK